MKALVSLRDLASRLNVSVKELRALCERIDGRNGRYSFHSVARRRRPDLVRQVRNPEQDLKELQRRITAKILLPLGYADHAHGGVRGRSPRSNASFHLGKPSVVTIDAKRFFPSLRPTRVYHYFRFQQGFGHDVSRILTRLVTLEGGLPMGAPTSMAMANLLLRPDVDSGAHDLAVARGLTLTRFVDDIAISGDEPFVMATDVAKLLSRLGLRTHRHRKGVKSKFKIMPNNRCQIVTGLVVNSTFGPSVPIKERDAVRAAIHRLQTIPNGAARDKAIKSIEGRIAYVQRYNPGNASRLRNQLAVVVARTLA